MEQILARNLLTLAEAYATASGLRDSTVARHCSQDSAFFSRIRGGKTFTARKYDLVLQWFSDNWPEDASWPASIDRPETGAIAAAFATPSGHVCTPALPSLGDRNAARVPACPAKSSPAFSQAAAR